MHNRPCSPLSLTPTTWLHLSREPLEIRRWGLDEELIRNRVPLLRHWSLGVSFELEDQHVGVLFHRGAPGKALWFRVVDGKPELLEHPPDVEPLGALRDQAAVLSS